MTDIQKARINTAGAYVCIDGLFLFAIGAQPNNGRTPVFRLGGHREEHENGWQCAVREVYEETKLQIHLLTPQTTYLLPDGDQTEAELETIGWQHETEPEHIPVLVVAYRGEGNMQLSLMYLAQAEGFPTPTSEIKGLLLLAKEDVHRLCQEPVTLEQYLSGGGKALLNYGFDQSLILEPFIQLRLLARILLKEPGNRTAAYR
jgi:ADP-ribose pyrophosphatase YjhB (NUDIX family)